MQDFHVYMKKQLIKYMDDEQKKGHSLEEIKKVILDSGHDKNIVDECIAELKKEEAGLDPKKPKNEVESDILTNLVDSIKKFFSQATENDVKKAKDDVKKHPGEEIVKKAIKAEEKKENALEEEKKEETDLRIAEGTVFLLYLVMLVITCLITAGSTDDEFMVVVLGFSAAFLNAFISFALLTFSDMVPLYMLVPVLVSGAFYGIAGYGNIPVFSEMEVESLSIINAMISFVFNLIIINIVVLKQQKKKKIDKKKRKQKKTPLATKELEKTTVVSKQKTGSKNEFRKHIDDLRKEFNL